MEQHLLISLAGIIIIGTAAQWLAMRLRLPSILFLLVFGFLAGPVFNFLHPDKIFGNLLFPFVSLSVAVILFEGGMDLKISKLKNIGKIVRNLISVGVLSTWIMVTGAAYYILHLDLSLSILFGAILVVTGPTVIGPLLRHVRPSGRVGEIVKWEGIMNDPIGVLIAVLVFEAILVGNIQEAGALVLVGILKTVFLSSIVGIASGFILTFLLKRYLIPDALHQVVTLMFIFGSFIIANALQHESGLLAVTLMGVFMANQDKVAVKHILEFKENLRVLIISILFIILSARLSLSDFHNLDWRHVTFLVLLIIVIRPVSVCLAALGTDLKWKEKLFISLMAPRGIVAAAMASVFSYELIKANHVQAASLVPLTFMVIVVTVGFYGLVITPVSRFMGISKVNPQGILILGAHSWARLIAKKLQSLGFKVILVDTNRKNIRLAAKEGLSVYYENVLQSDIDEKIDLDDIGKLFCLTSNDEANALATLRFRNIFGMANVYQVAPEFVEGEKAADYAPKYLTGRYLFRTGYDFKRLSEIFASKFTFEEMKITENFNVETFSAKGKDGTLPLFLVKENKELVVIAVDDPPELMLGDTLVYLSKAL